MSPLLFSLAALADPGTDGIQLVERGSVLEVRLREPAVGPFDGGRLDDLLEWASGRAPLNTEVIRVMRPTPDGGWRNVVLDLPELPPVPDKEPTPQSLPADNPGAADGFLTGKGVYLSQAHGWFYTSNTFAVQRTVVFQTVEDFHNAEAINQYLAPYLENAGASVFTVRERDHQTQTAIADNDGSGYTEVGSGFANGAAGFASATSYAFGVDPFDSGTTRVFPANGGGIARWTPTVPEDGLYAVYVSWDSDPNNATDAHYRIIHPGGTIDRYFNQTVHGSTWQYVERLWLNQGSSLTVELVGDSSQAGRNLSADAVRIGGGMGIVSRGGGTSGRPRWEDGGMLSTQYNGAPTSVYDPGTAAPDALSRSKWADWEHPSGEDAVYVSWHSNAFNGSARGTNTYYAGGGADSPHAAECSAPAITGTYTLADFVQDEMISTILANHDPTWNDRGIARSCFLEVNPSYNDEMPAILLENGFHDNAEDTAQIKDPSFRRDVSKAVARGIVRYFADQDGTTPVFQPEPPVAVRAEHDVGGTRLSWQAGPTGGTNGDAATGYLVYTSTDGRAWDNGFAVTGTTTVIDSPYEPRFYRVVATNAGGQSFPSEVVGSYRSPDEVAQILVVGAFDRLDAGLLATENITPLGDMKRLDVRAVNDKATIAHHGRALGLAGWYFDSASDEALSNLNLDAYDLVIWATGEESTVDETFSAAQQTDIQAYLAGGGQLLASGAEILWDLDERGNAADQAFASSVLGATMAADASSSTVVNGTGILSGVTLDFGDGRYPVEFPDVLGSTRTPIANYGSGELAAVYGSGVALFGFPLDAIDDDAALAALFTALLPEMVTDLPPTPPPPDTDPPDTDLPPDTDTPPDTDVPPEDTGVPNARPDLDRVAISDLGRGCGCSVGSGHVWWAMLLLPLVARRRVG